MVHVPDAVWEETVGRHRIPAERIGQLSNVRRHAENTGEVQSFVDRKALGHLQYGEQSCLWLLSRRQATLVLTDDLAVREAVKKLGGTPVGSLGIVIRAHREGQISLEGAEQLLVELHRSSTLFVTEAIIELAIEQLQHRM